MNSEINLVSSPDLAIPGRLHSGYAKRTAAMWPALQQTLQQHIMGKEPGDPSRINEIYVTGLSLGGGISQLLAYKMQASAALACLVGACRHRCSKQQQARLAWQARRSRHQLSLLAIPN
jgi:esterase/lipase